MTHDLLLTTSRERHGWWAECECGWIGSTYRTEQAAKASHAIHQTREASTVGK